MPPLKTMNPELGNKEVGIIGAPLDLGQERRGVDMGPSAIRYSGLSERLETMGIEVHDHGDARTEIPELASERDETARYLPAILGSCAQIAKNVANSAQSGAVPLVLGGDHSIAMGSLAGLHSVHGPGGVLWIDAHGDLTRRPHLPPATCTACLSPQRWVHATSPSMVSIKLPGLIQGEWRSSACANWTRARSGSYARRASPF